MTRFYGCEESDDTADAVSGSDIVSGLAGGVVLYVWHPSAPWCGRGRRETLEDAPAPDATVSSSVLNGVTASARKRGIMAELAAGTYDAAGSGALYAEVPGTAWGDYSGNLIDRANYKALLDLFGGVFVQLSGDWSSSALLIRVDDTRYPAHLAQVLHALEDYPLVDDEVYSQLEQQLAREAWDLYGKQEFLSYAAGVLQFGDPDRWREADLDTDSAFCEYMDSRATSWFSDTAREDPDHAQMPSGNPEWRNGCAYVCEDAVSVAFPHLERAAALFAARMIGEYSGTLPSSTTA